MSEENRDGVPPIFGFILGVVLFWVGVLLWRFFITVVVPWAMNNPKTATCFFFGMMFLGWANENSVFWDKI